jgi:molybdopterin converting factor small subunit
MALVKVKTLGNAEIKEFSVDTVGELKKELSLENYSANVNGNAQGDEYELSDAELVTFAPSVKGGQ